MAAGLVSIRVTSLVSYFTELSNVTTEMMEWSHWIGGLIVQDKQLHQDINFYLPPPTETEETIINYNKIIKNNPLTY